MARMIVSLAAVILSLCVIDRAAAQPPDQERGKEAPRTSTSSTAAGNHFLHIPGLFPLSMGSVQRDIHLTPEQKQDLKRISDSYAAAVQRLSKTFSALDDEEKKQQAHDFGQQQAESARHTQRKAEAVLTQEQLQGVKTIAFELLGTAALADPNVQEKLNLSPEQRQHLNRIFEQAGEKTQQLQRETSQQAMMVLDEQQATDLRKQVETPQKPKPQE